MIRRPVVSGTFYPSNSLKLETLIENFTPPKLTTKETKGAILPHAGYIYSGKTAIETVANIKPKKTLIIIGPNHTGRGMPFSVYSHGSWTTPLGEIAIAEGVAREIIKKGLLEDDTEAHLYEHSIEVQLPILKYFFKDFVFVPIVCITAELAKYKRIAQALYEVLNEKKVLNDSLIIASSDMTHYEPSEVAERKDKYVLEAILSLDTQLFLKRVQDQNVSMCGVAPVSVLLEILKLIEAKESRLVKYSTSGDVNNDYSSVVGYAGVVFN
jgi:AmmeMemoRadiSam system protein B